jgi:xylulokinase
MEAVAAMVHVESTFEPNVGLQGLYGEQHAIYRGIYEAIAQSGQYAALSDFSQKYQ